MVYKHKISHIPHGPTQSVNDGTLLLLEYVITNESVTTQHNFRCSSCVYRHNPLIELPAG